MIPVPLRSLSLAESADGETLLVLEVGGSALAVYALTWTISTMSKI